MGKRKAKSLPEEINPLMPGCTLNACRVNCKKNPNCFNIIGERFWFREIEDTHWIHCEDPEESRRAKGNHVGVKNLGATCYMNAFLQLWFHNRKFRKSIYDWRSTSGYEPSCQKDSFVDSHELNHTSETNEKDIPDFPEQLVPYFGDAPGEAVCACLQYLFTMLQHSEKRYIDPSSIVQCLGLQPDEQQDAQEFSKLFISLLEDALVLQNNNIDNIIGSQFGGEYIYETTCSVCGNLSQRPSKFYELDLNIKGHLRLRESIREFLKEEILEGDNKYFCSKCNMKNNAVRRIKLQRLPPVLNLQLLRFIFDRETGMKRKLNSNIQFPDVLDMNEYMKFEDKATGLYELSSVLLHRGPSAHSGHYVAHILEEETESWYRCNDEEVEVIKGRKLQLGREEDLECIQEDGTVKKHKLNKSGYHSSKNAYMLVYRRCSEKKDICDVSPPPYMENIVASDNSLFEGWVEQVRRVRHSMVLKGKQRQQEIQRIFAMLPVKSGDDYEWINSDWLKTWLKADLSTTPPIDNTAVLCKHAKADPKKMQNMKRISISAANYFYETFGGLPRLKSDGLCTSCLDKDAKIRNFEAKLKEDQQLIIPILKPHYRISDNGYWVGKSSLKQWKQLATKLFEASFEEEKSCQEPFPDINGKSDNFNEEIVCLDHGNLNTEINRRMLVPNHIWKVLTKYFENARAFTYDSQICKQCQAKDETSRDEKEAYKLVAKEQKAALSFLLNRNELIIQNILLEECSTFYVLTTEFISEWKRYVRSSIAKPIQPLIDMSDLLCDHGKLLYNAEEIIDEASSNEGGVTLLTADEYKILIQMYQFSNEVTLFKQTLPRNVTLDAPACEKQEQVDDSFTHDNDVEAVCSQVLSGCENSSKLESSTVDLVETSYTISPDYCSQCRLNRLKEEAIESEGYKYAAIYVLKQKSTDFKAIDLTNDAPMKENYDKRESPLLQNHCSIVIESLHHEHSEKNSMLPGTPVIHAKQRSSPTANDIELPEELMKKLVKIEKEEANDRDYVTPPSSKKSKRTPTDISSRKSSRQRTKRGEYLVRVDSDHTLKQLKIQLLSIFSVLPCDQHIRFENGDELKGDDRTLADLKVRPETHLLMCVDEPNLQAGVCVEDISSVNTGSTRVAEEGFKGTSLLGNSPSIQHS